jgi:hypothetical protein
MYKLYISLDYLHLIMHCVCVCVYVWKAGRIHVHLTYLLSIHKFYFLLFWFIKGIILQSLPSYEDMKNKAVARNATIWKLNIILLLVNCEETCMIWSSHSGEYEVGCVLGCSAV